VLDLIPLFARWKNSFARVNRLPPEILTRVAQFSSLHDLYAGLRVCRYWYNVLMSPEVWSEIDLDRIEEAQIFLIRSKEVPADIGITQRPGGIQLSILSACSSRIRSLQISSGAVSRDLLTHFSVTPAPLMRDLRITRDGHSPTYFRLPSTFFTGNLPSLRTLVLSDISSDFTRLVLPNLTTFELRDVGDPDATLSPSSLLNFLARSPLLERLHLDYRSHYDDAVSPRRIVALHHLKWVYINGEPLTPVDTSRSLLAHLSLPAGVVVNLWVYIHGSDTDVVARTIPFHHDLIPCTKSLKEIRFHHLLRSCFAAFSGDNGCFTINASLQGEYEAGATMAICSFGSLDVSGVQTLVVEYYGYTHHYLTQALKSLVNLRSLTLKQCVNEPPLHALCQEGTSPRLRYLAMDLPRHRVWATNLLEMAKVRKLRGHGLETLSLHLSSSDNLVGDTSSLREYVGSIQCTIGRGPTRSVIR